MSGTIPLSMTQQMDQYGDPLAGGKLYGIVAGTVSTPQNFFQDSALTLPWPNPVTLDVSGRIPQLFLADGLIKIRLQDKNGVIQLVADNVQVIGPSGGGGGGGGTVDATTIYQTGDLKPRYGTGIHTGWVRANGRTIGNSLSGATELASDTAAFALFSHLWSVDPNLAVSGGRGANPAADFNIGGIGKQLTLPDMKGTVLAGMDDMGAAPAGRLTAAYFGASGIVLGARGGLESHLLTQAELPNVTLATAIAAGQGSHSHPENMFVGDQQSQPGGGAAGGHNAGTTTGAATLPAMVGTTPLGGSNTPHAVVQPTMVVSIYIKL